MLVFFGGAGLLAGLVGVFCFCCCFFVFLCVFFLGFNVLIFLLLIINSVGASVTYDALKNACDRLIAAETRLNTLDTEGGDGDTGSTLARGARGTSQFAF